MVCRGLLVISDTVVVAVLACGCVLLWVVDGCAKFRRCSGFIW